MRKIHYGWFVCFACILQLFVSAGLACTAFGSYLPYVIEENGFTNAQGSLIITVRTIAVLASMFLVDRFYTRFTSRTGLLYAALCAVLGFVCFANASSLFVYCIGGILAGISNGLGSMIPISVLISRWFRSRRAFALSICSAGTGIATTVIPPVVTMLVQRFGLQGAFAAACIFMAVASSLVFLVLRNSPEELELQPYQSGKAESERRQTRKCLYINLTSGEQLWMMAASFLIGSAGISVSFLTLLYTTCGYPEALAALVFSAVGLALTLGKFIIGYITDSIGGYRSAMIAYTSMVVGLVLSSLLFLHSSMLLVISVPFMGLGLTTTTIGISYIAEDFSTKESYGNVLKRLQIAHTSGVLLFSYVIGAVADFSGGYTIPFVMVTILTGGALIITVRMYYKKIHAFAD